MTVAINDSVVATISGSRFEGDVSVVGNFYVSGNVSDFTATGSAKFNAGLSGSLTRLTDGSPYMVAGTNVNIVSSSNGQIVISSTGGGSGAEFHKEMLASVSRIT